MLLKNYSHLLKLYHRICDLPLMKMKPKFWQLQKVELYETMDRTLVSTTCIWVPQLIRIMILQNLTTNRCYFAVSKCMRSRNIFRTTKSKTLIVLGLICGSEASTITKADERLLSIFDRTSCEKYMEESTKMVSHFKMILIFFLS